MSDGSFIEVTKQAVDYIERVGGMPEIARASTDLRAALDVTRTEIETATFASRFPTTTSDYFNAVRSRVNYTPIAEAMIDKEGEAGAKRAQLLADIQRIDGDLNFLIYRLVELRADLKTAQQEF